MSQAHLRQSKSLGLKQHALLTAVRRPGAKFGAHLNRYRVRQDPLGPQLNWARHRRAHMCAIDILYQNLTLYSGEYGVF